MGVAERWEGKGGDGSWWRTALGKLGAGAEWAFSPFTVSGEMTWGATHGAAIPWVPLGGFAGHPEYIDPVSQLPVWTKQALEEKGVGGYLGSFLPGGEVHERYRELPIWQQLLYETPALIATGGITAGGIRGALKPAAEAATIAGRTAKVARAALKPAELVETGIAKATSKITNPILKRLGLQMEAQKTARRATTKVRKVELRERVANAESIYKKVMQETGDPELARRASMNALRGEMPTVKAGAIGEALTPEEVTQLRLKISEHANYFERIRADSSLNKLFFTEDVLQPAELKLLERIFPGVSELNTLKLKMGSGLWSQFVDIANLPRALLASTDLSITLRQGGILLARFPGGFKDVMKVQLRTLFSSDNWKYYDDLIRTDPDFYLFENVGGKVHGYLAPEPGAAVKIGAREEYFPSALAEKIIPTVKPSERAFTAGGNYLRYFGGFKKWWSLAQKAGYTDQNTIEGIIKLVNWSTGRGSLPRWAGTGAPFVNAMLFAPRFVFSRLQLPTLLFHSSPFVRKEAARTLVQFLGAGITVLSLASAAGAKVELDPRSSDFGKIRVGNTRLDIWAGYVQWARFLAQAVTGQSKVTGTGEIVERNRLDTIMNLIQSKESPFASIFTDLMKGETFTGEPVISWESLRSRFTPLFIQDLLDAIETDGWQGAAVSGAPALLGVGAVSYEAKRQKPSGLPGLPSSGLPTLPK